MAVMNLLVADDDPVARDLLVEVLTREGYHVRTTPGGEECLRVVQEERFDLALVDLRMPDLDGLEVLNRLRALRGDLPVVILTAFATMESAIEAIHAGATDYLSKPFRMEDITAVVRRALDAQRLAPATLHIREGVEPTVRSHDLVGQSAGMVEVYKLIARVADLESTVLIQGETGTGKELVARAIHHASPRGERPFVVVDCAALPESLFESELFGHERGAFTGALAARRGLLEAADGGTCFLDEIAELTPALQAKLLRTLQERALRRVGGNDLIPLNVRMLAATNQPMERRVAEGGFRGDLYYRLSTVTITIPPLRERPQDVPALARHFLERYAAATNKPIKGLAAETLRMLADYGWPGNVRELEHVIERAVALSSSEVLLPDDLQALRVKTEARSLLPTAQLTLEEMKYWYVTKVLEEEGGNKRRAAEILGIDRRTLYRILERRSSESDLRA